MRVVLPAALAGALVGEAFLERSDGILRRVGVPGRAFGVALERVRALAGGARLRLGGGRRLAGFPRSVPRRAQLTLEHLPALAALGSGRGFGGGRKRDVAERLEARRRDVGDESSLGEERASVVRGGGGLERRPHAIERRLRCRATRSFE